MLLSFPVSRSWFKWCLDQRNVPPCSLKPRLCKPYMSLLFWTSSDVLMFCNKLSLLSSVKIFLYIPTSLLFMGSRQDSKLPILLSPHSSSHWALFVPAERSCYNAECCNNVTSFCVFHGNSELSSPFASRFFLQDNQFRLQYVFSSFYDGGGGGMSNTYIQNRWTKCTFKQCCLIYDIQNFKNIVKDSQSNK